MPDARTIWLFREKLTKHNLVEELFALFGEELKRKAVIGTAGKIVEASFVEAPKQRNMARLEQILRLKIQIA